MYLGHYVLNYGGQYLKRVRHSKYGMFWLIIHQIGTRARSDDLTFELPQRFQPYALSSVQGDIIHKKLGSNLNSLLSKSYCSSGSTRILFVEFRHGSDR